MFEAALLPVATIRKRHEEVPIKRQMEKEETEYTYDVVIHSSINGHLGYLHPLATMNNPAVNIRLQVSVWTSSAHLLGVYPGMAGLRRNPMFKLCGDS